MSAQSQERAETVISALINAVRGVITEHRVTYDEYHLASDFVRKVGEFGEWQLLADVFFEATVEQIACEGSAASDSTIAGPFYIPGAQELTAPYVLPMRVDEPGDPLVLSGTVTSADGNPIAGATIEMWQCDTEGTYSNIPYPDGRELSPPGNLRGQFKADASGRYEVRTITPVPYEIPKAGPTGSLLAAAGWHAFRPAHLHCLVSAPGHQPLMTQLYLDGDPYIDSDVASAVKPGLILKLSPSPEGTNFTEHSFRLATA